MSAKEFWSLSKEVFNRWLNDKSPKMAAALSYYTVFSMAPILIIAVAVAGLIFDKTAARHELHSQMAKLIGEQSASGVMTIMENAARSHGGILATILGIGAFIFGATGVFNELQDSLNTIWRVKERRFKGWRGLLHQRFLSFVMVVVIGFLLLTSLLLSAILSGISDWLAFAEVLSGKSQFWQVVNLVGSFSVVTILFAMIFKILPDAKIAWRDVWLGALFSSIFFTAGKYMIGIYLGRSAIASTYGAAGSLAIILIWVYFASQILFLGAEITQVFAHRFGSKRS